MNNIELLLPAYAKKQLSDSGGRQVVDKMFDVSLNRRIVEWSGTDRPEFTDFGVSKVCVEAERTNELDNPYFNGALGSNPPDGWLHANHDTGGTIELIESAFPGRQAVRLVTGASERSYITNNKLLDDGIYTISMWLESLSGVYTGSGIVGANISSVNYPLSEFKGFDPNGEFPQFVWHTFEKTGSSTNLRIGRGVASAVGAGEMVFSGVQVEKGSYPTLLVDGTRLAPTVPIQDALPETGTVAFVVDAVRTVGVNQYFFDTAGDTSSQRTRFFIGISNSFHCFVYGSQGGVINIPFPFSIPNNQRFLLKGAMSWDADSLNVYVEHEGQGHLYQADHKINSTALKRVFLGSFGSGSDWGSMRFLTPWAKTDQVLTTEEEFEQLFETIS